MKFLVEFDGPDCQYVDIVHIGVEADRQSLFLVQQPCL